VVESEEDKERNTEEDEQRVLISAALDNQGHDKSAAYGIDETLEIVGRKTIPDYLCAIYYISIKHKAQQYATKDVAKENNDHSLVFYPLPDVDKAGSTRIEGQTEMNYDKEAECKHTRAHHPAKFDEYGAAKADTCASQDASDKYVFHKRYVLCCKIRHLR